ncbi:ABC transporter permease [Nitratireductor sp. GCM10026969]|uniref:ABC transporter permease n=1 Tax=Nitratireductor sp. GCM10026969 TaxID=3252645 RepID=UPI00360BCE65
MTSMMTIEQPSRKGELPLIERYINILGPLVMILLVCLVMVVVEPRFFGVTNVMIILQDAAIYMVLGMAMTIVISGRGIDLSIGAVAALAGVVMAMLIKDYGWGAYMAMLAAITIGIVCGLANGLVITKLNVPDLIATLAMDQVYRGIALVLAAGAVLARFPEPIPLLGRGRLFDVVPTAAIIGVITLAIGYVIYHYTHLGRYAVAIGGNREAAILTGININRHKIYHYMLMGGAAAFAGILLTGRLNAIQATAGHGFALHTIAAVVVGGTVLFGGRGTMVGTLVGVLLLSMVTNALVLLRFQFFWQLVASGLIIIVSIGFYSYLQRRRTDRAEE